MNVVLIGYRGTGKSSVAHLVAGATGRRVFSMDDEIVRRADCSITDFVARHGWEPFRDLESEVAKEAGLMNNTVVDTGGGVVLRPANMAAVKKNGVAVWLQARVDTIAARIGEDSGRPSLTGSKTFVEEITEVLDARTPLYAAAADFAIATDDQPLEDVAREIVEWLSTARPVDHPVENNS